MSKVCLSSGEEGIPDLPEDICIQGCGSQGTSGEENPQVSQSSGPRYPMFFCLNEELHTLGDSFFAEWEGRDAGQHQKRQLQSYDQWQVTQCLGLDHRYRSSNRQKRSTEDFAALSGNPESF